MDNQPDRIQYPIATVGGMILAEDGEVLLVRSKKWLGCYSLPGGKIERGETKEQAFIREIKEETALNITAVEFAIVQDSIFSNQFFQKSHFIMHDFVARLALGTKKEDVVLNDEAESFIWVSIDKALTLNVNKETSVLLNWYLQNKDEGNQTLLIGIDSLAIDCIIGDNDDERERSQTIYVDMNVKGCFVSAASTDSIHKTVNYDLLAKLCKREAIDGSYRLLETLAVRLCNVILAQFDLIEHVWVRIKKGNAIKEAAYAYVEMQKSRGK